MPTIKPAYRCAWCSRKIGDPNLKEKVHYCGTRCQELHDRFKARKRLDGWLHAFTGSARRCGNCHEQGHNRQKCPFKP